MSDTRIESKNKDNLKTDFWEPKLGDSLIGLLVTIRVSKYGKDLYDIKTSEGIVTVKSSVVLQDVIDKSLLDKKIRIKYLGFKMGTGTNKYRDYEVYLVDL